jgi:hypothetical protein
VPAATKVAARSNSIYKCTKNSSPNREPHFDFRRAWEKTTAPLISTLVFVSARLWVGTVTRSLVFREHQGFANYSDQIRRTSTWAKLIWMWVPLTWKHTKAIRRLARFFGGRPLYTYPTTSRAERTRKVQELDDNPVTDYGINRTPSVQHAYRWCPVLIWR